MEIKAEKHICVLCGKDFGKTPRALNKKTKYCTGACKTAAWRFRKFGYTRKSIYIGYRKAL